MTPGRRPGRAAVSDMGAKIDAAMGKAEKVTQKDLKADLDEVSKDAAADS